MTSSGVSSSGGASRFVGANGFGIVLDMVASAGPMLSWSPELLHRFFNGVFVEYSDALEECLAAARRQAGESAIPYVRSTGDGLMVLTAEAALGVELCLSLQAAADRSAPELRKWIEQNTDLDEQNLALKDPFAFGAGIGMSQGIYFEDRDRQGRDGSMLESFSGPAFVGATRISAKARARKAVFSPLLDSSVVEACRAEGGRQNVFFFLVGEYLLNTKSRHETMHLRGGSGDGQTRKLYSAVPSSSRLVDLAGHVDEIIRELYEGRYATIQQSLAAAHAALEELHSTPDEVSPMALRRWDAGIKYIDQKVQMNGFLS